MTSSDTARKMLNSAAADIAEAQRLLDSDRPGASVKASLAASKLVLFSHSNGLVELHEALQGAVGESGVPRG